MQAYEYTVLPAPNRGEKVRGARTGVERFAHALTMEINRMAQSGWEYVRAETLPCEERSGLTSRTTVYHNVLVFRRALAPAQPQYDTVPAQRPLAASHEAGPALRPLAAAQPVEAQSSQSVPVDPPSDWPDGEPVDDDSTLSEPAKAEAARVDDYDEPAFDPDRTEGSAEAPPFIQRPPLAAQRPEPRAGGIFSEPMTGNGSRLGPAER